MRGGFMPEETKVPEGTELDPPHRRPAPNSNVQLEGIAQSIEEFAKGCAAQVRSLMTDE
jgi:hypothetical protein